MARFANTHTTADEQVAFAWKYRDHFAEVGRHNIAVGIARHRGHGGEYRNAWSELADMPDAKPDCPMAKAA